ncbi:hypothetical protein F444_05368 [Phytophthora nicotianae P1976]|uniref:HAT C-terminal dimerisation domain-containing protein n=1 Tax=Phytophthora nicotianae P1976 TaxID=1317066 RepID=A0A081AMC2_PHYNI|nr:hypothetical protein F444_05368 [Phytophthora nicotianae P1976]
MGDRGGRPPGQEARHFKVLKELGKAPGGYSHRECRFCRAAYDNDTTTTPPQIIIGRARNYKSHLAKCTYYKAAQIPAPSPCTPIKPGLVTTTADTSPALSSEITPKPPQPPAPTATQLPIGGVTAASSKSRARRVLVLEQKRSPRKSLHTLLPVTKKAKHEKRKFSRCEIKQIERSLIELHADNHLADRFIEQESTQRFMELVCPGLTDILPSRRALGTRVLKEHATRCKTMDTKALRAMEESTNGWVNLLSDVWQNVSKEHFLGCQLSLFGVLLTYALLPAGDSHHGIAIAKQLEEVLERAHDEKPKAANAVNAVNASSSKWLPRARKMMKKLYGKSLGLRTLCETRWNSMQGCFASLLRVQTALQMFFRKYKKDSELPSTARVFGDLLFWEELKKAEAIIAPLSFASYRLQRDENTVADVVVSFRDIFRGFQRHIVRHDALDVCIADCWAQCEQPLFMLGFALHPGRLFNTEDTGHLRRDMLAWMKGRFTRTKYSEFPNAPWEYWECVATERPKSQLPNLAMRVLSIAVNTATCEQLFSELGLIHTAKRNRMAANKTLDYHIIAKHIIFDVANSSHLFTPSPQRGAVIKEDESDDEDPGDGVDGDSTLSLWGDFLDEVFEDEEIGAGYTENETFTSTAESQVTDRLVEDELDNLIDEFEFIPVHPRSD